MSAKQILFLVLSLVILFGCARTLPNGMPKLYPVTASVTQEGQPFAGASVSLRYLDPSDGAWAIGGMTDADGNVALVTNGYPGAPLGKFKVVLLKTEIEGKEQFNQAVLRHDSVAARQLHARIRAISFVRAEYNSPESTPIEVEITAKTKTLNIDAGPAVRIEQKKVPL